MLSALIAVYALTVMAPGHAELLVAMAQQQEQSFSSQMYSDTGERLQGVVNKLTTPLININPRELACLAKNIFFEAGSESEEGKVAVGLVTINRTQDGRFAKTICGVVDQKLTRDVAHKQVVERRTWFSVEQQEQTVWSKISICQFSWRCMFVKEPKRQDQRWLDSQRVAEELLSDSNSYGDLREKYSSALYFHATAVKPSWARQKAVVDRVGGHFFYTERTDK